MLILYLLLIALAIINIIIGILQYRRYFLYKKEVIEKEESNHLQDFLTELNKIMASTILLEDLVDKLLTSLFDKLNVSEGALLLIVDNKISWAKTLGFHSNPAFDEQVLLHAFESLNKEIIVVEDLPESTMKHYFKTHNRAILAILKTKGEIEGVLVLGEKKSKQKYNNEDIKIIEFLIPEMAIAIKNAESFEEIRKFNEMLQKEVDTATSDMKKINEEMYKKNVDLKHLSDQLVEANSKLQQLDHLKDEFVSLASHELRTPMTAIKSYLWLFLENKDLALNEKQKTYIERAYQATDRLINLVNDMLNVSRIESGRMNITLKPFSMIKLINEVSEELKPTAIKQKVSLSIEIDDPNLPEVTADQNKIREVIINLLGNSLKFTDENGKITIRLHRENEVLVTQIKDTGKGIKAEDLSKLFHKFQTVGSNYLTKRNSQGTGLGLYLSKSIIELHKGKIWAESEGESKGSIFSFTLPITANNKNTSETQISHTPQQSIN